MGISRSTQNVGSLTVADDVIIVDDLSIGDDVTLASGSVLTWATDTNLYRSAADTLKTDDALTVDGTLSGGIINPTGANAGGLVTGRYYYQGAAVSGYAKPTQDTAYLSPFVVRQTQAFDRIATTIQTAGELTTVVRLAVLTKAVGSLVFTSVVETSALDATGTGKIEGTIAITLTPGVYWLALVQQAGADTLLRIPRATAGGPVIGNIGLLDPVNEFGLSYSKTGVTAAIGSPTVTAEATGAQFQVFLRAA